MRPRRRTGRARRYAPLEGTIKHRSILARYVEGQRWEDTPLFTEIYARRLAATVTVRGCETIEQLAAQYYGRVDALCEDMRRHGFREDRPESRRISRC